MKCAACLLAGMSSEEDAKFVINGFSVCEEHWNTAASSERYHDFVMRSRYPERF